jgi:hypothetical protein
MSRVCEPLVLVGVLVQIVLLGMSRTAQGGEPKGWEPPPIEEHSFHSPEEVEDKDIGYAISGAGDIDGDGFDDLLVGASGNQGSVLVYYGALSGLRAGFDIVNASDMEIGDAFGRYLQGLGDVDQDGYDDVLVIAGSADIVDASGEESLGRAYLLYGSGSGLLEGETFTSSPGLTSG